ncbi:sensor histidine kinase [Arthrobacter sp. M4]|uniref:sensor histidine kinase n=1 Tax=Arthrobacter sp. M4 TaxID=218160 RepID=UPI001CDD677A|nr:ATP-binding protein [Arthrobacter sp. M4]MCA4135041.1 ATP-binding protein [Arthrobacter sp. M4]
MYQAPALDEVTAIGGVITDRKPVDFHALGLAGCIDRLTAPLRREGTEVHWETPHHGLEVSSGCAALLYEAAREALSNAFKYAHAKDVTVRLAAVYHGIRMAVLDNGDGFNKEALATNANPIPAGEPHHGYGLRLMAVAVQGAGGTVVVDSSPGHGTAVTVTLPLE